MPTIKGDHNLWQYSERHDPSTNQVDTKKDLSTIQVPFKFRFSLKKMDDQFMSMKSMMEVRGLKSRMTFRENYVTPALNDKAIGRKYPNEPNHPKQMYKLTEQALEWRESQTDSNKK